MDLAEQLQKLQSLREQGVLTEEEFTLAKKRVIEGGGAEGRRENTTGGSNSASNSSQPSALQQFRRSSRDRWIGGICGGLANMSNIPAWAWRILFVLTLCLHGIGILLYILLWIFVPLQADVPPPVAKVEPS